MTPTEQQILALLARKREDDQTIDRNDQEQIYLCTSYDWLIEAVELLLRHQIELREELRNNGILR